MKLIIKIIFLVFFSTIKTNIFVMSGQVFIKQCIKPGNVALTFDDGPSEYTNEIIDILNQNKVKGTFFVSGNKLNKTLHQEIIKRIVRDGHILGSHMYSHKIINKLTDQEIFDEMQLTSNVIFNITGNLPKIKLFRWIFHFYYDQGVRPRYMRTPFGAYSQKMESILSVLGYKAFLWNLATRDWRLSKNSTQILKDLQDQLEKPLFRYEKKSLLVLQHDTLRVTLEIQDKLIKYIQSKKFKIVSLNECIGETHKDSLFHLNLNNFNINGHNHHYKLNSTRLISTVYLVFVILGLFFMIIFQLIKRKYSFLVIFKILLKY